LTYYTGVEFRRHEAAQVQDEARRFIQLVAAKQEHPIEKGKDLLLRPNRISGADDDRLYQAPGPQ
jgi:hypothetical protein